MGGSQSSTAPDYYVPAPSNWPMVGMLSMVLTTFGASLVVNRYDSGWIALALGFAVLIYMFFGWFGAVIRESETGSYNRKVDVSFRWGMSWFIFSEVMFFSAFFGALFYARIITVPALGDFDSKILWPDFTSAWPTVGPAGIVEPFTKIHAWPLPTLNTFLLVTSGIWLTIAHHALRANHRSKAVFWLVMTLIFGFTFVGVQA